MAAVAVVSSFCSSDGLLTFGTRVPLTASIEAEDKNFQLFVFCAFIVYSTGSPSTDLFCLVPHQVN